jgi:hypothetical protein
MLGSRRVGARLRVNAVRPLSTTYVRSPRMPRSKRLPESPANRHGVSEARLGSATSGQPAGLVPGPVSPSHVLDLQRSVGNAAVARLARTATGPAQRTPTASPTAPIEGPVLQRRLTVGGREIDSNEITKQSAYKRRLNSVISEEAAELGLAPNAVRRELVNMAKAGDHQFDTARSAVHEAIRRLIVSLPVAKLPIRGLVKRALAGLTGATLTQSAILDRLEASFQGDKNRLHEATRRPEFAEALLEEIRTKQSKSWIKATAIRQVKPSTWANDEQQYWDVRHYTSKFMVVLGAPAGDGIFSVQDVQPPPFTELLSSITLATMDRAGGGDAAAYKSGDTMMMTFTSGAASSGHTTGVDWKNIGNVGDTFYGLFYRDEPATGITPNFIRDAVYYAKWPIDQFGIGWASADWLGTAAESQMPGGKVPEGEARQGPLADIIADILPAAITPEFNAAASRSQREAAFSAMPNFEVKKHGSMTVSAWLPLSGNIEKIKRWQVDTKSGKFIKLDTAVQSGVVDTPGYALLKEARGLGLFEIEQVGREEVYSFRNREVDERKFDGESVLAAALDSEPELFAGLAKEVEAKKASLAEAERNAPKTQPPSAPPLPPPPVGPGKKLVVGHGGGKDPH